MKLLIVHPLYTQWPPYIPLVDEKVRAMVRAGHDVLVLCEQAGAPVLFDGREAACPVFGYAFDKNGLIERSLKKRMVDFEPDLIHVWTPRSLPSRVGLELAVATGAKLAVNYEDPDPLHFGTTTGAFNGQSWIERFEQPGMTPGMIEEFLASMNWSWFLKTIQDPKPSEFLHPLYYLLLNYVAVGFSGICRRWVARLEHAYHKPVVHLPHSIDFKRTLSPKQDKAAIRREFGLASDALVLLRSGTVYSWVDDQEYMLLGFKAFLKDWPNTQLLLAGVDLKNEGTRIEQRIASLGLCDHVRWMGFLNHEKYCKLLSISDIALCPGFADAYNRFRLATKIVDYMAAAIPMLCYAVGIGEELEHGRDAMLLDPYTPEQVRHCLDILARDAELRCYMGQQARVLAEQWFDTEKVGRRLVGFYKRLLEPDSDESDSGRSGFNSRDLFRAVVRRVPELAGQGIRDIALYGGGKHSVRLLEMTDLAPLRISCIVDDHPQVEAIHGIPVVTPARLSGFAVDAVLISSDSKEPLLLERARSWLPGHVRLFGLYA